MNSDRNEPWLALLALIGLLAAAAAVRLCWQLALGGV
jgi:hypothetical protein